MCTYFSNGSVHTECHDKVEEALIEDFEEAHHQGNISGMRDCAETLLPFKVCSEPHVSPSGFHLSVKSNSKYLQWLTVALLCSVKYSINVRFCVL